MDNLSTVLISKGEIEEPEYLLREYISNSENTKGPSDLSVLAACHELAVLLYERKELIEAEKLFSRVVAGRRSILKSGHLDTLSALNNLGKSSVYRFVFRSCLIFLNSIRRICCLRAG